MRKPETCGYKVASNSEVTLHYRARAWGEEEFYENTYGDGEPLKYKLGMNFKNIYTLSIFINLVPIHRKR